MPACSSRSDPDPALLSIVILLSPQGNCVPGPSLLSRGSGFRSPRQPWACRPACDCSTGVVVCAPSVVASKIAFHAGGCVTAGVARAPEPERHDGRATQPLRAGTGAASSLLLTSGSDATAAGSSCGDMPATWSRGPH